MRSEFKDSRGKRGFGIRAGLPALKRRGSEKLKELIKARRGRNEQDGTCERIEQTEEERRTSRIETMY